MHRLSETIIRYILPIFSLLMYLVPAVASIPGNNITVRDGLAHNTVQSIVQDKYGFIWIGTLNGISRYDGYTIKNYQASPGNPHSIRNNRIQIFYIDRNKDLWVSTFDSIICKYDYARDNFTRYKSNEVSIEIRNGTNRFVNTSRLHTSGAGKEFYIQDNKSLFERNLSTGVIRDARNLFPFSISKQDLNCVFVDRSNVLWIGTIYNGAFKIDLMANPFLPVEDIVTRQGEKAGVRCLLKDKNWLLAGTFEDGLSLRNVQSGAIRNFAPPLTASTKVRSLFKDHFGDIWIGYNNGVDRMDARTGKITPVSLRGEVTRYDRDVWLKMTNLPNRNYFCIAEDASNTVWLGTYNGIFRYNRASNSFRYFDLSRYANCSIIACILGSSDNKLWLGSEGGGVFCLERNQSADSWHVIQKYCFQDGSPESLPDDRVYAIQQDKTGALWVGTENGLCRIDPKLKKVLVFDQKNGLADPGVASLLLDKHNQLWISHKKGISRMDIHTFSIKNYTIPAVDKNGQFLICSGFYDATEDHIYFGYSQGYVHFSPGSIQDNPLLPVPLLVELKVNNQSVGVDQPINDRLILQHPLYESRGITLTHRERSFSIEFTATHYANPELNRFEYILEGVDKKWTTTNADNRTATYSALSPGNYVFRVRTVNANNLMSREEARLEITILAPWWVRWWAIVLYVAIAGGLLYLFLSMQLSKQRIQYQLGLEKIRTEQMEELTRMRTNFFTNISHELRTPLTLIIDPLNRLLTNQADAKNKVRMEVVKRNADRLLKLVNELLDVRKAEEGSLKLNYQPVDLNELIDFVRSAFLVAAEERGIAIRKESQLEKLPVLVDREGLETVLYNLLVNALKNADAGSSILISLSLTGDSDLGQIELRIQNQGKAIDPNALERIFDPFFQSDTGAKTAMRGTGLGLTITRQLVELHGGKIKAESRNGLTTFMISLPYLPAEAAPPTHENDENRQYETNEGIAVTDQPAEFTAGKPVLLLIEDHTDIRQYIKSELEESYNIVEAVDGNSGIEMTRNLIPDLVITDVMMPGKDGFEVCSEIRNDTRICHIPVIMLTARQSEESQIEGYESGADSYLTKPFSIQMLEARINNLLSRQKRVAVINPGESDELASDISQNEFITELKNLILHAENYNVEMLADKLSMSRSQLYRKIKSLTNQSATDFISGVRMHYACELLEQGELNVSEIALKLGYSEQANFSRSFYRRFGKYPSQYIADKI